MSTLDRLCASGLQPSPDSRGNEEMDMQDFRCVAMRLARLDLYACYDFLGGGSETAAMAILVSLHGCTISMCTGEAGRFLLDPGNANMENINKLESDSSNAYSYG